MSKKEQETIVYVQSLGCAKNLVDTEVMCGALSTQGAFLTDQLELANVFLINTCGFIRDAKQESYNAIRDALKWKRQGHGRRVVVAGCLAQRELPTLKQKYPRWISTWGWTMCRESRNCSSRRHLKRSHSSSHCPNTFMTMTRRA